MKVYYINWLVVSLTLIIWPISGTPQTVPAPPDVQTIKSCSDYLQATFEALQAENKESGECMKSSPSHIGMKMGCSSDGQILPPSLSAWPNAENLNINVVLYAHKTTLTTA
jgi:hypothetical protein